MSGLFNGGFGLDIAILGGMAEEIAHEEAEQKRLERELFQNEDEGPDFDKDDFDHEDRDEF